MAKTEGVGGEFLNVVGAATTQISTSRGTLHRILYNNPTAGDSVTISDTDGVSTPIVIGIMKAPATGATPVYFEYECQFDNGLEIITVGVNSDITVVYD
jgi:hypothetical protein